MRPRKRGRVPGLIILMLLCLTSRTMAQSPPTQDSRAAENLADDTKSLTEVNKELTNPISSIWSITFQENNSAYREAVGRCNGTEVLRNSPASVNNTAYGAGWACDAHEQFTAPSISFDEVVARCGGPVELVKIDTEGAEADILEGASPAALAHARRFVLESHDSFVAGSLARCERVLVSAGFHCVARSDPWRAGLSILYAARDASDIRLTQASRPEPRLRFNGKAIRSRNTHPGSPV